MGSPKPVGGHQGYHPSTCLPSGLDPACGGNPELLLWELSPGGCQHCPSPRRGPSSPVLGQQEPEHLMVTFNQHLSQQSRKVWSKCTALASCSKDASGESWSQLISQKCQLQSRAAALDEEARAATDTWPLWIWPPGSRCTN